MPRRTAQTLSESTPLCQASSRPAMGQRSLYMTPSIDSTSFAAVPSEFTDAITQQIERCAPWSAPCHFTLRGADSLEADPLGHTFASGKQGIWDRRCGLLDRLQAS